MFFKKEPLVNNLKEDSHTFQGSVNFIKTGSNVTINITYNDNSIIGNFIGYTVTYTKQSEKLKNKENKDKFLDLLQTLKK